MVSPLWQQHQDIIACPKCAGQMQLSPDRNTLGCLQCRQEYPFQEGVPRLFWSNDWKDSRKDVTETMRSFYERTPFPNYDDIDSRWSLREKAGKGLFASLLDDQIPHGARVLEAGCGTGQLSNFLGMTHGRTVFAADMCLNSLALAHGFKSGNGIENTAFLQMNLFRPAFRPESFDLVISNGVLHHTSDPKLGFRSIAKLVKKGGFIIVGLYNSFGRIPTYATRAMLALTRDRVRGLDPKLRTPQGGAARKQAWFMDQYKNPHESAHTIGEVLRWFSEEGFEFMNSVPKSRMFEHFAPDEQLFTPHQAGGRVDHFFIQLQMLLSGGADGGLFVMIGRKKA